MEVEENMTSTGEPIPGQSGFEQGHRVEVSADVESSRMIGELKTLNEQLGNRLIMETMGPDRHHSLVAFKGVSEGPVPGVVTGPKDGKNGPILIDPVFAKRMLELGDYKKTFDEMSTRGDVKFPPVNLVGSEEQFQQWSDAVRNAKIEIRTQIEKDRAGNEFVPKASKVVSDLSSEFADIKTPLPPYNPATSISG